MTYKQLIINNLNMKFKRFKEFTQIVDYPSLNIKLPKYVNVYIYIYINIYIHIIGFVFLGILGVYGKEKNFVLWG